MQSGAFETILRNVTVVFYSTFWSRSRSDTTHLAPIFANVNRRVTRHVSLHKYLYMLFDLLVRE